MSYWKYIAKKKLQNQLAIGTVLTAITSFGTGMLVTYKTQQPVIGVSTTVLIAITGYFLYKIILNNEIQKLKQEASEKSTKPEGENQ